ncbi:hypothetical protein GCM10011332_33350 [Terasakiella brassicae]|uniref:2'-5' RNA ligase n=1 Tax=Terasakiella brassicae TaxID=1634917 RepID=A0A917CAJ7_9PROT|nr:hypothetical protein [Terasakiella brassicae]GGF76683.1 hypothetical protein GCM10011332_33350 [Terasakiella brassicae]
MSSPKYFLYVKFSTSKLTDLINLLIFLSDPKEKNGLHLTLRGPYTQRVLTESEEMFSRIRRELFKTKVSVFGLGNFFKYGQSTLYLRAESDLVSKYLWKKNIKKPIPHLTIYDGASKEFSNRLANTLSLYRFFFELQIDKVDVYSTISGQKSMELAFDLNLDLLLEVTGKRYKYEDFRDMKEWERLMLINRICPRIEYEVSNMRIINT